VREEFRFHDRADAGRQLAAELLELELPRPLVLGLPRGGVPVAAEVASALGAPLDVFVALKIGAPRQPELGIGALAEGQEEPLLSPAALHAGLDRAGLGRLAGPVRDDITRRVALYRDGRPPPEMEGLDIILVDDGLATGVTAEAALSVLRRGRPHRLVLAVPVGAPATIARLGGSADRVVAALEPVEFYAVGQWYDDFRQTSDEEVLRLLAPGGA